MKYFLTIEMPKERDITEATVTIVCCKQCSRSGRIIVHEGRFWCAWCNAWCDAETRLVHNVVVSGDELRLAPFDPEQPTLQSLRIPQGWTVSYNNGLYELDPSPETIEYWWIFKEDMLLLQHEKYNRLLDVGWIPECDYENGGYYLQVYEGSFLGRRLYELRTKDRSELVREIERLLKEISDGRL